VLPTAIVLLFIGAAMRDLISASWIALS